VFNNLYRREAKMKHLSKMFAVIMLVSAGSIAPVSDAQAWNMMPWNNNGGDMPWNGNGMPWNGNNNWAPWNNNNGWNNGWRPWNNGGYGAPYGYAPYGYGAPYGYAPQVAPPVMPMPAPAAPTAAQ
jgi:hypothetical protein